MANAGAAVTPIVADYGNVFPTLTEQNLDEVFRTSAPAPWYVSFNLTMDSDVALGVLPLPRSPDGSIFNPTAIRIVTFDNGTDVADGTDTFLHNPFPDPIEHLVVANYLSAGKYALEVSGDGDRHLFGNGLPDFTVRLQVMPIPEPETYALMLAGLGMVGFMARRRQRSCVFTQRATDPHRLRG